MFYQKISREYTLLFFLLLYDDLLLVRSCNLFSRKVVGKKNLKQKEKEKKKKKDVWNARASGACLVGHLMFQHFVFELELIYSVAIHEL